MSKELEETRNLLREISDLYYNESKKCAELKAENERLNNLITLNEKTSNNFLQQLKEKDQEIEEYQKLVNDTCNQFMVCSLSETYKKYIDMCNDVVRLTDINSTNTKQVCNKIKSEIIDLTSFTENELRNMIYDLDAKTVLETVDQIEKGEV